MAEQAGLREQVPVARLLGRVVLKGGINYTVIETSRIEKREYIVLHDPTGGEPIIFDSQATFNNWAYGTPVPANHRSGDPDA